MISLETYYLSGLPIKLKDDMGVIYPLTIRFMLENNIDYNEFLRPFLIRLDMLETKVEGDAKDFDIFLASANREDSLIDMLIESLKILYKTDNIIFLDKLGKIVINDEYIIDRNNFTYFANVILEMMYAVRQKPKKKEQKYKNPQLQAIWDKLQLNREREEKKKELQLVDILNALIHMNNQIDYDKVLNFTYYQVMNSYTTLLKKEGYNEMMMYKTSGQFTIEQDIKHWTIETRIKKSAYSE